MIRITRELHFLIYFIFCNYKTRSFLGGKVDVDLSSFNHSAIAGVFKHWLMELNDPLLTFKLYDDWIAAQGKSTTFHSEL